MMQRTWGAALLAVLVTVSGCSIFKGMMANSAKYDVSLSTTGVVTVPPTKLGTVDLPVGSVDLASLGFGLASGFLAQQHGVKECQFAAAQAPADAPKGTLVVGASANCMLHGQPIALGVAVTFTPAS